LKKKPLPTSIIKGEKEKITDETAIWRVKM